MAPSSLLPDRLSSPRRFSTTYIASAISTATSPLQASFQLSCRSPIRPTYGELNDEPRRLNSSTTTTTTNNRSPGYYREPASPLPFSLGIPGSSVRSSEVRPDGRAHYEDPGRKSFQELTAASETWLLQELGPGLLASPLEAAPRRQHQRRRRRRSDAERKLGVVSAINIIVGKTIGVGAYSVPSAIFAGVGSVGMTLLLWVLGSIISFCGLAVYLDFGTAMPRSGGERVYLERIFRRPRMLATCMFMAYVVLLGFSTPNAIVLGEYTLYALDAPVNRWNVRVIAVAAVSCLCWIHSRHPRLGLRLINVLGVAKMLILVFVVIAGVVGGLMGVGSDLSEGERVLLAPRRLDVVFSGVSSSSSSTAQRNFSDVWAGSSTQPYDYATALLKVIYCFRGYSTANQVLDDVQDPVRTLKIAAPVALSIVSLAYLAITVAFFLVVDKNDFKSAGIVVAGVFFRNVFGPGAPSHVILPLFIIISAAGNIAATSFAQARVNEELAKDGLLPWSRFWRTSSSRQASAPPAVDHALDDDDGYDDDSHSESSASTSDSSSTHNYPHHEYHHHALAEFKALPLITRTKPPQHKNKPSPRSAAPTTAGAPPTRGLLLHWLISTLVIVLPPPGRIYNFLVDVGSYPVSVLGVAISCGLLYLHSSSASKYRTPFRAPHPAVAVFAASNCLLLILPWVPPAGGREDGGAAGFVWFAYPATALAVLAAGAAWWTRDAVAMDGERTATLVVDEAAQRLLFVVDYDDDDDDDDEVEEQHGAAGLP
ncbi:amino acid permease-domain-containing protein [Lasiosphaeria miniovina]|uniref:Amino acid permease-domain-containing protein n=1 Tax=Lasiosphaeria miniovina TaxID=1954250 RepID=A0AA40AJV6_9PEZI|nr:amino acid permease-domain-containing protein [Lasiosphaeria miniovina]KAK0717163.1 amino acid permease-domain-containing protein [Lasiosphaeria miniovina]